VIKVTQLSPNVRQLLNGLIVVCSVMICFLLSPARLPGMELLGIGPDWLLIWLVTWSLKHNVFQAAIAGIALGLVQDGMTSTAHSHVFVFVVVGFLTARIQKQRYIQEDFISVALIVFVMTMVAKTAAAIQYSIQGLASLEQIWIDYQRIALSSAILSSLWAPALYYPLNRWWNQIRISE
jgi:rod shape-determining protein MreD